MSTIYQWSLQESVISVTNIRNGSQCFVCGEDNPKGLHLTWQTKHFRSETEFYPHRDHQGWEGYVHGGILATLLDEAMTRLAWKTYGPVLTAEMKVRYFNPARIGEKLIVSGEIEPTKNRIIIGRSEVRTPQGRLIASASGKVLKPKEKST